MADSYPYMISNNKISAILAKIRSAAKPSKFTHEFLKQLGFVSSNDRAILSVLKRMGFLSEDGAPLEYYDRLRDHTDWQFVLGERIKELYKDLFNIDTEIYKANDTEVKGAISRVTGKDETSVNRYLATFKTLVGLAKFGTSPKIKEKPEQTPPPVQATDEKPDVKVVPETNSKIEFCHNIQIHLPATTDISVYNAIFKSIKENLLN